MSILKVYQLHVVPEQVENFKYLMLRLKDILKLNDKEYSLNSTKFKQEKKQLNATYKVLDSLFKLQKELVVKNSAADALPVDAAKDKVGYRVPSIVSDHDTLNDLLLSSQYLHSNNNNKV